MKFQTTTIIIIVVIVLTTIFMTSSAMEEDLLDSYLDRRVQPHLRKVKPQQQKIPRNDSNNNNGCPKKCSQCSAYNGCITCRPRHFLFIEWQNMRQMGVCVARCPQGYYPKVWNPGDRPKKRHGKCSKCTIENCEKCRTKERCGRCLQPYFLHRGRCLQKCPPKAHLFHPEERKCRKPGQGIVLNCDKNKDTGVDNDKECKPSQWTPWSKCFYKSSAHCIGLQTRSRFFLFRFNSWNRNHLLRNLDYEMKMAGVDGRKERENSRRNNKRLFNRIAGSSKSANDLPLGSSAGNSSALDLALYQKFKLNEIIRCPDPEYEYRKCYRKDRFCRET